MLCGEASIYLGWRYTCRKCANSYNHGVGEAKTKPKLMRPQASPNSRKTDDLNFCLIRRRPWFFLQWPHACVWQARMVTTYNPTGGLAMPSGRHTAGKCTRLPKCRTLQRQDARQCSRKMDDGGRERTLNVCLLKMHLRILTMATCMYLAGQDGHHLKIQREARPDH